MLSTVMVRPFTLSCSCLFTPLNRTAFPFISCIPLNILTFLKPKGWANDSRQLPFPSDVVITKVYKFGVSAFHGSTSLNCFLMLISVSFSFSSFSSAMKISLPALSRSLTFTLLPLTGEFTMASRLKSPSLYSFTRSAFSLKSFILVCGRA